MEFVKFLESRLIFNILFLNVCKQTFHISHVRISQELKGILMWNLKHIVFILRRRYWQIFKSALVYLFKSNDYPESFINNCFKAFLGNKHRMKEKVTNVPKFFVLPYYYHYKLQTSPENLWKAFSIVANHRLCLRVKTN